MATVASTPSLLDLQAGAPRIEPNSVEVMTITMKTRKVDPSGNVLTTGNSYSVAKAFGMTAVEQGWASDTNAVLPNRIGRTVDEQRRVVNTFTYDGSLRLTSFVADGLSFFISYPSTTLIDVYIGANGKRITLNASQQVTSIADI